MPYVRGASHFPSNNALTASGAFGITDDFFNHHSGTLSRNRSLMRQMNENLSHVLRFLGLSEHDLSLSLKWELLVMFTSFRNARQDWLRLVINEDNAPLSNVLCFIMMHHVSPLVAVRVFRAMTGRILLKKFSKPRIHQLANSFTSALSDRGDIPQSHASRYSKNVITRCTTVAKHASLAELRYFRHFLLAHGRLYIGRSP